MSKVAADMSLYIEIIINSSNIHHTNDCQRAVVHVIVVMSVYTLIRHDLCGNNANGNLSLYEKFFLFSWLVVLLSLSDSGTKLDGSLKL